MSAALVFQCEELASEILEYLAPGPLRRTDTIQYRIHRRERQRSLACAARVSRAWRNPALRVLWRVVEGVMPLLSLLPPLVCIQPEFDSGREAEYLLSRDITQAEWTHFQDHANHVRELHVNPMPIDPTKSTSGPVISSTVWIILSRWCSRDGLCPRLQRLESLCLSASQSHELILISPKLRYLDLDFHGFQDFRAERMAVRSLFVHLRPVLHRLEGLRLGTGTRFCIDMDFDNEDDEQDTTGFTPFDLAELTALKHLEMVGLPAMLRSDGLLDTFDRMNLHSLSVFVCSFNPVPVLLADVSDLGATLRELRLRGSLDALTRLTAYAAGPSLHTLDLTFHDLYRIEAEALRQTFDQIGSSVTDNLRRLHVKLQGTSTIASGLDARLFFQPLLEKAHLSDIALTSSGIDLRLNKETLRLITTAWPNLTTLLIETDDGASCYPPLLSFEDMAEFVAYHPALKELALPHLNATALPRVDAVPVSNIGLEIFRLSSISTREGHRKETLFKLALLFDRLFPNLDLSAALTDELDRGRDRDCWDEVQDYMVALQAGRRSPHHYHICGSGGVFA
ncbi:hypothetical protein OH77DRAFT_1517761 [Trametes cingulata]|nr:hypothetical protein OH77DRAFT_1517761 [Trametes cingulata]